jgi:hypothetical protein
MMKNTAPLTDPMAVDEREAKLPAWAQGKLDALRRRTRAAERASQEAALATDPDGSDAYIERFGSLGIPGAAPNIGLGKDVRITWRIGERSLRGNRIEAHLGRLHGVGSVLQLRSDGARLMVLPGNSNSLAVTLIDD